MLTVWPLVVVFLSEPAEGEGGRFVALSLELSANAQEGAFPLSFPVYQ